MKLQYLISYIKFIYLNVNFIILKIKIKYTKYIYDNINIYFVI